MSHSGSRREIESEPAGLGPAKIHSEVVSNAVCDELEASRRAMSTATRAVSNWLEGVSDRSGMDTGDPAVFFRSRLGGLWFRKTLRG